MTVAWRRFDVDKPRAEDLDLHGYVLVWSRSAFCALTVHADTLTRGALWMPLPKGPTS